MHLIKYAVLAILNETELAIEGNENQEKPFNVVLTCQIWQGFICNSMQII